MKEIDKKTGNLLFAAFNISLIFSRERNSIDLIASEITHKPFTLNSEISPTTRDDLSNFDIRYARSRTVFFRWPSLPSSSRERLLHHRASPLRHPCRRRSNDRRPDTERERAKPRLRERKRNKWESTMYINWRVKSNNKEKKKDLIDISHPTDEFIFRICSQLLLSIRSRNLI